MNNLTKIEKGSLTAINGFKNEDDIIVKFNDWTVDNDAKNWFIIMGYSINEIEYVKAEKVVGYKTDVQVQVNIKLKNL